MEKIFDSILSYEGGGGAKKYLVSPRSILDFFSHGIQIIRIPNYQRPYSWTAKNINDLLMDVGKVADKEDASWFLGPIFTVRKSTEDNYTDLLDGQQRITTIQIILREATLITYEEEGIDISQYKDLQQKLNLVYQACNSCLIKLDGFNQVPRFETEESINEIFESYILGFNTITSYQELKDKRSEFDRKLLKAKRDGSKTAGTIEVAINLIRKYFKTNFIKTGNTTVENLIVFYDFIDALVNKCWVIDIPLQEHNDSIQIFESLNNRGKSLTLVDKLRYKSIIKCSNQNIDKIRMQWKKVYAGLNFLTDDGYVKDEDDFFKVFFNSIKGDGFTKEEDFITLFEEEYLNSDTSIEKFLEETLSIITFYRYLSESLDQKNRFISDYFQKDEQNKVKALLRLLNQTLDISDNSRVLLFYLIRNYSEYKTTNYTVVQGIWNIIRTVMYYEMFTSEKSNKVRNIYMERIKAFHSKKKVIADSTFISDFNFYVSLNNIIKTTSNSDAKYILYFYAYLNDYTDLISHSPDQYSKSHLDHLFPRAWKGFWNDNSFKMTDIASYIKSNYSVKAGYFKNLNFEQFKLDIENSFEKIELPNYTTAAIHEEESIIEFIGNKWILHASTNISTSNYGFEKKKLEYQEDKWIKIPSNNIPVTGILAYDNFTYKEVLDRSLCICSYIIDNFENSWDDI